MNAALVEVRDVTLVTTGLLNTGNLIQHFSIMTCSFPRRDVCSHSLVCSKNSLLIVGIGPIHDKEL